MRFADRRIPASNPELSSDLSSIGDGSDSDDINSTSDNESDELQDHIRNHIPVDAKDVSLLWETFFVFVFVNRYLSEIVCTPMVTSIFLTRIQDLEHAFHSAKSSKLLSDIILKSLNNLNYAYRGKRAKLDTCMLLFQKYVDYRLKKGDCILDENPMTDDSDYCSLNPGLKVVLLKELCEWQLCEASIIHDQLEKRPKNANNKEVYAKDLNGNKIFHCGDNARFYQENTITKSWRAMTSSIAELHEYVDKLSKKDNHIKNKIKILIPRLIKIEEAFKAKEIEQNLAAERDMLRKVAQDTAELEGPRRSVRSTKVKRNYADMDDSVQRREIQHGDSPPKTGSRISSRLNRNIGEYELFQLKDDGLIEYSSAAEKSNALLESIQEDLVILDSLTPELPNGIEHT